MASKSQHVWLAPSIAKYIEAHTASPDDVLRELRAETSRTHSEDEALMQVSADQGALLTLLAGLTGGMFAVEVGTFTGYSAISIVRGLRPEGRLLCCDVSETYTAVAKAAWQRAGLSDRIELKLAPAADTLRRLPQSEHIDLAFIDADKLGYATYWDELVPRLRPGGLLIVDNTLWSGTVADPAITAETTEAVRAFNDKVAADQRMLSYILPVADGLTIARKA